MFDHLPKHSRELLEWLDESGRVTVEEATSNIIKALARIEKDALDRDLELNARILKLESRS